MSCTPGVMLVFFELAVPNPESLKWRNPVVVPENDNLTIQ
jgi:hypothetical protein